MSVIGMVIYIIIFILALLYNAYSFFKFSEVLDNVYGYKKFVYKIRDFTMEECMDFLSQNGRYNPVISYKFKNESYNFGVIKFGDISNYFGRGNGNARAKYRVVLYRKDNILYLKADYLDSFFTPGKLQIQAIHRFFRDELHGEIIENA